MSTKQLRSDFMNIDRIYSGSADWKHNNFNTLAAKCIAGDIR